MRRALAPLVALTLLLPSAHAQPAAADPSEPGADVVFTPQCDHLQFLAELVCFSFGNWVTQLVLALAGIGLAPVGCVFTEPILQCAL